MSISEQQLYPPIKIIALHPFRPKLCLQTKN